MPYPPPVPPTGRLNTTPQNDNHPSDHNLISEALTEILNILGVDPANGRTSLSAFLDELSADLLAPVGTIHIWPGSAAPSVKWALCRGQLVAKADNPVLWGRIGAAYGFSDANNFTLPSFVGRVPVGMYPAGPFATALGQYAGTADNTLVAHSHPINSNTNYANVDHSHSGNTNTTGHHNHNLGSNEQLWWLGGTTVGVYGPASGTGLGLATWVAQGDHYHTITTGGQSQNHLHAINTVTDPTGHTGLNYNLQPYTVVNYIIRLG